MRCVKCGEERHSEFYPNNKSLCKTCYNKRQVILNQQPKHKERQARYYKRWYAKRGRKRSDNYQGVIVVWQKAHQDSRKVAGIVRQAIKAGLLGKPLHCIICDREGKVQAHHDNYNLPLEVIWLCASCHKKLHLEMKT